MGAKRAKTRSNPPPKTVIIGAGIGGLAAALTLAAQGTEVIVYDRHDHAGGKIRAMQTPSGPVDYGPTVVTLLPYLEELLAELGETLSEHVEVEAEPLLARHFWPDGSQLDLFADRAASIAAVEAFSGRASADAFDRFSRQAATSLQAFEVPVMRAPRISRPAVATAAMKAGADLLALLAPNRTLTDTTQSAFADPRLAQLFGRYATYVGGIPTLSPALLGLIWAAEERGVWRVRGGISALASALQRIAEAHGVRFRLGSGIARIECRNGRVCGVVTDNGEREETATVVFNGDPAALLRGLLGRAAQQAVTEAGVTPRSLSAAVWSGLAVVEGVELAHHNVFFGQDPATEFEPLAQGEMPDDATLYICAQDRGDETRPPQGPERFEIIMNAPPLTGEDRPRAQEEKARWQEKMLKWLSQRGLALTPEPDAWRLTTPQDFAQAFPGSDGSLYGRSPHGMMASFQRPTVRSRIPGLYLAGGGVHPGPGVPMALLSGRHAGAAIAEDRISTSRFRRMAMRGGMSTGSPTPATKPYQSSAS
ncbi:MAG: 1-hydroxycarotenoid 3,4-desaturase CrtD [Pseudomonadota bacterium]